MDSLLASNSPTFSWVILPLLIFVARVIDVSLGTIRLLFLSRGFRFLAPLCGFFEVFIWLLAMGQIMQNLTNIICYVSYAAGFATGNFVGIYIERRLAIGTVVIRTITRKDASELLRFLRSEGFGVTNIIAEGSTGPVQVIYTVVKRRDVPDVVNAIQQFNPKAFFLVEDVRSVREGVFRLTTPRYNNIQLLRQRKKEK